MLDAIRRIQRAAAEAGLVAGIHASEGKTGRAMAQLGFQMITLAAESQALRRGAAEHLREAHRTVTDDHAAIRELIAAYALALDAGDIEGCVELFTADAQFLVYGRSFDGHDGIRKMFQDAPRGLHLTGVSRIDVHGNTADGPVAGAVRQGRRPASAARRCTTTNSFATVRQWRFQRRRCQFVTSRGLSDSPEVTSS